MSYDKTIGYDPNKGHSYAPTTYDQYARDFAITFANKYANGTVGAYGGPGGILSDAIAGFKLAPEEAGSGTASQNTYNQLYALGLRVAKGEVPASAMAGLAPITGLSDEGGLSDTDKNNLTAAAIANMQEAGMNARSAAELANRMSIAQLQEAGASARNAAQIAAQLQIAGIESADRRYSTDVNAAVNREDIAARERIAAADRASRESIATADRGESAREFDLRLGEDRRQFNSTLLTGMLDRGIALAQKPVDWIGYQYWLGTIGAAVDIMNLTSAAATFGAVPPSGPSAAGPVVGGPAVIDGDVALAQAVGVQGGPVTVAQAIQEHPGGTLSEASQDGAASNTVAQYGGVVAVDQQLAQSRQTELPAAGVDQAFLQQAVTVANQAQTAGLATRAGQLGGGNGQSLPSIPAPAVPTQDVTRQPAVAMHSSALWQTPPAPTPVPVPVPTSPLTNVAGATPGSVGGIYTGNEQGSALGMSAPVDNLVPAGAQMSAPVDTIAPSSTPAASTTQPQGSTSNIDQLLAQLAQSSGIPIETLRRLFPSNLMTPAYAADVVNNSPVIQALRGNAQLSGFNTGAANGPFTTIRATGAGLGIRGGQDVNATQFLTSTPAQQQMMQGAIEATGQYMPDFTQQMLRSAPLTNLDTGSIGRRVY